MFSSLSVLKVIGRASNAAAGLNVLLSQQQRLISGLIGASVTGPSFLLLPRVPLVGQQRYAARKGTRERKNKKTVKKEVSKKEFIPYAVRLSKIRPEDGPRRLVEKGKPEAIDDVYHMRHFMTKSLSLADTLQFHRESNHPTVYNCPDAIVTAKIELDMSMEKKNRYLDTFSRLLLMPHFFACQPVRKVLAFCKTQEIQDEALKGGADTVGGPELIKRIQIGDIALGDYDYFVAHTNMMTELTVLRGLLKKKLPITKNGSMGTDLPKMIERFSRGVEFTAKRDVYELDYAVAEVPFGRINMTTQELEANFDAVLKDIESCRGRPTGAFITRCFVLSPPSPERFVVNTEPYIGKHEEESSSSSSDSESDTEEEEEEKNEKKKAVKRPEEVEEMDDGPRVKVLSQS